MRSNLVLNEGRFLGEENVENVVGEGGVGGGYLGFDASLDGGFDLGGGGYVSGWIESFEHVERWRLLLGVGLEVVLVCLSYSSSVVVGVGLNRWTRIGQLYGIVVNRGQAVRPHHNQLHVQTTASIYPNINSINNTMTKSKKKSRSKPPEKNTQLNHLQQTIADANQLQSPLASLPAVFLQIDNIIPSSNDDDDETAAPTESLATIQYHQSPLPSNMLEQCLELFEMNMGDMYRRSSWGLDMDEKRKELMHVDARFLVVVETSNVEKEEDDDGGATTRVDAVEVADDTDGATATLTTADDK
eukprot:scaffold57_cov207-Alexandrium_tamarense.AAC.34